MKSFLEYITPDDEDFKSFDDLTIPELIGIQQQCQKDIGEKIDEAIGCDDWDEWNVILLEIKTAIFAYREYQVALESREAYRLMKDEFEKFEEKMEEIRHE